MWPIKELESIWCGLSRNRSGFVCLAHRAPVHTCTLYQTLCSICSQAAVEPKTWTMAAPCFRLSTCLRVELWITLVCQLQSIAVVLLPPIKCQAQSSKGLNAYWLQLLAAPASNSNRMSACQQCLLTELNKAAVPWSISSCTPTAVHTLL